MTWWLSAHGVHLLYKRVKIITQDLLFHPAHYNQKFFYWIFTLKVIVLEKGEKPFNGNNFHTIQFSTWLQLWEYWGEVRVTTVSQFARDERVPGRWEFQCWNPSHLGWTGSQPHEESGLSSLCLPLCIHTFVMTSLWTI